MFRSRKALILALFSLVFLGAHLAYPQVPAKVPFTREDLGLSLEYPSFFSPLRAPSPQVLLLLRPPTGRYPSFNILLEMGDPQVEKKSIDQLKGDITDSYRAVGLFDAEVINSEKRQGAGRTIFYTEVRYKQKDEPLRTGVYIIPGGEEYYVLTLISDEANFSSNVHYIDEIVSTLSLKTIAPPPPEPKRAGSPLFWLGTFLVFLLIVKGMFSLLKKLY